MKKNGFTLIEILVVVGILGILAVIGSNLFFSILRGSTKTKTFQLIKQNGDYAMSVMERMIRNARALTSPLESSTTTSITILNPDGGSTVFSCDNNLIASNGASLISNEIRVDNCSFTITVGAAEIKPAVVKINFDLSWKNQAGITPRPEEQASINFQTTVSLRNY